MLIRRKMGQQPCLELPFEPIGESDFTCYVEVVKFRKCLETYDTNKQPASSDPAARLGTRTLCDRYLDLGIPLSFTTDKREFSGRLHAVKCFQGKYYSVTIRGLRPEFGQIARNLNDVKQLGCAERFKDPATLTKRIDGWNPSICLTPVDALGKILFESIFAEARNPNGPIPAASGLVLFTGATASSKTTYLNSVFNMYLKRERPLYRARDHVVVVGDPIETRCYPAGFPDFDDPSWQFTRPFDFTARELGADKDVANVREATIDALRETPSVLVIGELRKQDDFRAALEFAGTGHLVLATSHSTSLVDAMDKLLRYTKTTTASGRATIANQVKAIVHHRSVATQPIYSFTPIKVEEGQGSEDSPKECASLSLNLPSIWLGNSQGQRNLVAEGLSSLVNAAPEKDRDSGVLGRYWVATKLMANDAIIHGLDTGTGENSEQLRQRAEHQILHLLGCGALSEFRKLALQLDLANE
jgi:hypothetical protein